VQSRERELHLGLDARSARDATPRRPLDDVLQQRGLADAGVAADDERAALARPNRIEQPVERPALAAPAEQSSLRDLARHPPELNLYRPRRRANTDACSHVRWA
jgi:hypothetical protein